MRPFRAHIVQHEALILRPAQKQLSNPTCQAGWHTLQTVVESADHASELTDIAWEVYVVVRVPASTSKIYIWPVSVESAIRFPSGLYEPLESEKHQYECTLPTHMLAVHPVLAPPRRQRRHALPESVWLRRVNNNVPRPACRGIGLALGIERDRPRCVADLVA